MDKDKEVLFPVAGVNVATEFGRQPDKTTPEGENVRAYEALTGRGRGGSRAGLSKFLADTVPAGAHLIQHLNVIVDPQSPSLLSGAALPSGSVPFPDPLNPGSYVRTGGSGIQVNPHAPARVTEVAFVQKKTLQNGITNASTVSLAFDAQPGTGHLMVAIVLQSGVSPGDSAPGVAVTNNLLNAYTQVGGPGHYIGADISSLSGSSQMSMFWRVASAGANDTTVRLTTGARGFLSVILLEYFNNDATLPFVATAESSRPRDGTEPLTLAQSCGPCNVSGQAGELVLAVFADGKSGTHSVTSPFSQIAFVGGEAFAQHRTGVSGAAPISAAASQTTVLSGLDWGWLGLMASFKKA